ncbi:hypothetical protein [Hyphobacterium sp.]
MRAITLFTGEWKSVSSGTQGGFLARQMHGFIGSIPETKNTGAPG